MKHSRRDVLAGLTSLTAAALSPHGFTQVPSLLPNQSPDSQSFPNLTGTYLDNASHHPMTTAAADAIRGYIDGVTIGQSASVSAEVRAKFAQLINADNEEITYAPSTSLGENLITQALGLPERGGRIITDALHFMGSFYLYEQLEQRGMDVVILPMQQDGSVSLSQYEEAMTNDTVLIAVSHVSWINGFVHDIKALSDLAHSGNAKLYVDIMQSVGNTPIDVKAMGIDFACCGTYKWLMGDFGLSFLYADNRLAEELIQPWYGYLQTNNFVTPETRMYPFDPSGAPPYRSDQRDGIARIFNGSFPPRMIEAGINVSLDMILDTSVESLQAYRQPLIEALQTTLRERGFRPYTPEGTESPIVSFIYRDAQSLNAQLTQANIAISTYNDRFRISPSFFNDMNDIDRVIEALGRA